MVHASRHHEEQVGQAVDVCEQGRLDGVWPERDDATLGASADRAREVERRPGGTAAREDEAPERWQLGLEPIDDLLESTCRFVTEGGLLDPAGDPVAGIGEPCSDRVQVTLQTNDRRVDLRVHAARARNAEGSVELVHLAVGFNARVGLRDARAVEEACLAQIAGARVDFHPTIILAWRRRSSDAATVGRAAGLPRAVGRPGLKPDVARDTNFYYSFLVLPPEKRRAIVAVWDFCRAVDDVADEPGESSSPAVIAGSLSAWRDEVARCFDGGAPRSPQGRALKALMPRFALPRQPFDDLIDGIAMDIGKRRYQTFEDLRGYCYKVASTVGLICLEIFGYRNLAARDYAVNLGLALQLTNILRDLRADLARDRLYVPLDELARFECTENDLRRGALTDAVGKLLRHQAVRARSYYERAHATLPREDAGRLVAPEIMGAIYVAILDEIEARGYDVFSDVVRISRPRRAWIAARTWVRVTAGVLVRA